MLFNGLQWNLPKPESQTGSKRISGWLSGWLYYIVSDINSFACQQHNGAESKQCFYLISPTLVNKRSLSVRMCCCVSFYSRRNLNINTPNLYLKRADDVRITYYNIHWRIWSPNCFLLNPPPPPLPTLVGDQIDSRPSETTDANHNANCVAVYWIRGGGPDDGAVIVRLCVACRRHCACVCVGAGVSNKYSQRAALFR